MWKTGPVDIADGGAVLIAATPIPATFIERSDTDDTDIDDVPGLSTITLKGPSA